MVNDNHRPIAPPDCGLRTVDCEIRSTTEFASKADRQLLTGFATRVVR